MSDAGIFFAKEQEAARKDVERAFGIPQQFRSRICKRQNAIRERPAIKPLTDVGNSAVVNNVRNF